MKGVYNLSVFYAILLGLVQGLTEFLPVSSSGHLVAFQEIFRIEEATLAFDVILHLGTLVAVVVFFWRDIVAMVKELFLWAGELIGVKKEKLSWRDNGYRVMMVMIIVASIPTAIIGLVFGDLFEKIFSSLHIVGFTLFITGGLLWLSNHMLRGRKQPQNITIADSITIGLIQGIAITPGISRSGSTIFAGLLRGFNNELAIRFSFLLSIPTILGAALLEGKKVFEVGQGFQDFLPIFIGFIVAAFSGYFAIRFLIGLINRKKLHYFSYYCWSAGLVIILYSLFFH